MSKQYVFLKGLYRLAVMFGVPYPFAMAMLMFTLPVLFITKNFLLAPAIGFLIWLVGRMWGLKHYDQIHSWFFIAYAIETYFIKGFFLLGWAQL